MKPSYVVPALWAAFLVASLPAQSTAPPAPAATLQASSTEAWVTKTYRFPADRLTTGFVSRDKGQLKAPRFPKAGASDGELLEFLRRSDSIVTFYLKEQDITLPEGSLAAYDPENQTLVVRTSGKAQEMVDVWAKRLVSQQPASLTFATYLIEGEAHVVRELVKEAAGRGDHSPQLAKLKKLVDEGKARQVDLLRVETRSGQKAGVERGEDRQTGHEFSGSKNGWTEVAYETHQVGSRMEIDPVLAPDGETIDLNIDLNHDYRQPVDRWEPASQTGAGVRADVRVTDFYTVEVKSAQSLMRGTARLLGVWKPEGAPEPDRENRLLVAIVRGDVVPLLAALEPRLEKVFASQGEKIRPTPAVVPEAAQDPSLPPGMIIRRFVVTPSFLARGASGETDMAGAAPAAADPFSSTPLSNEPRMTVRITALDILRAQGIDFPRGASANFNSSNGELIVRNTPENMAQVEEFIGSITMQLPVNISCNIQIVQVEGALLRKLEEEYAARADHGKMWEVVEEAATQGRAKYLQSLWIGTRSGQRVTSRVVREYNYVSETSREQTKAPAKAAEGKPTEPASAPVEATLSAVTEMNHVGLSLEVDPVIGPDGRTIDVNYSLNRHYAAPSWRPALSSDDPKVIKLDAPATSFHKAQTISTIAVLPGMVRLIGLWKPEGTPEGGNADVLQAAFLRADLDVLEPIAR